MGCDSAGSVFGGADLQVDYKTLGTFEDREDLLGCWSELSLNLN